MKFKLILDPTHEEEVVATVHARSALIDEVEALVNACAANVLYGYDHDGVRILKTADIECVSVTDGKTYAYADGKVFLLKKRLYEIEQTLPPSFIRINKSAVGNRDKFKRLKTAFSGAVDVEFDSGHVEYVSRRCFADIKRRYGL